MEASGSHFMLVDSSHCLNMEQPLEAVMIALDVLVSNLTGI